MESIHPPLPVMKISDHEQAWEMVLSQLRPEMSRALYETWVQPLRPVTYCEGTFTLSAVNPYTRDWVESRLSSRITRLLEGLYQQPVQLKILVGNVYYQSEGMEKTTQTDETEKAETFEEPVVTPLEGAKNLAPRTRKVMLQRAYGSKRAAVIQPERGLFVTLYFLQQWTPLIGHSAVAVILAARSMCYWNPMTGELRNEIETEIGELASRAATSVRTVKMILKDELVRRFFLRYRVRRMMTPNGVRTAGIALLVRMDDPLTPQDQDLQGLTEEETWYSAEYDDLEED